jgi:hypothetical protein
MKIYAHSFIRTLVSLTLLICGSATAQETEANALNSSFPAVPFAGFASALSSRDLLENKIDGLLLKKRQTSQCSIPGGRE